jgi:hypothetical protein
MCTQMSCRDKERESNTLACIVIYINPPDHRQKLLLAQFSVLVLVALDDGAIHLRVCVRERERKNMSTNTYMCVCIK